MNASRLIILEPSKVGTQHITLIASYLRAAVATGDRPVEMWCAASMWDSLPSCLTSEVRHRQIPVIDPSSRRFLVKIPLEVLVTLWAILRKGRNDILLITCLFSPALYQVTRIIRWLRPSSVFVVLHSEIEAVVDKTLSPRFTGYGYWIRRFWQRCLDYDTPGLVVIDRFIRDRLLTLPEGCLRPERLNVLTMPISVAERDADTKVAGRKRVKPKACFVGFRSRLKGFDEFAEMAAKRDDFAWLAIGGGIVEDMATGEITPLECPEDFAHALSACDVAVFPYRAGYEVSMSAAVLDALSVGLHVIASPRGCFEALSEALGEDLVQCADGADEMNDALNRWLALTEHPDQAAVSRRIAASRFSQSNLNEEMRTLVASCDKSSSSIEAVS
jgi:glycosyltransferase involved in cell wall biosynthesis